MLLAKICKLTCKLNSNISLIDVVNLSKVTLKHNNDLNRNELVYSVNETIYVLSYDTESIYLDASYDNGTNWSRLWTYRENISKIQSERYTITVTTNANSYSFHNTTVNVPEGCKIASITLSIDSSIYMTPTIDSYNNTTGLIYFSVKNDSDSEATKNVYIDVLFIPIN